MRSFVKYFVTAFLVLTLIFIPGSFAADKLMGFRLFAGTDSLMKELNVLVDPNSPLYEAYSNNNRVNILVMGVNGGLTDTIMVASYDMKEQQVDVISVPRDTYYDREGVSGAAQKKINSILKSSVNGGVVGIATAVSETLQGMPIHYYAIIDYDGVGNIVETIGGVPMDIPFNMVYDDPYDKPPLHINIPAGYQVLSGEDSVKFLRYRKGYPNGDIGRVEAQQKFIKSAFKEAIGLNLPAVITSILNNVESDLDLGMALKIAGKATRLDSDSINTYTIPGNSGTKNGLSYWWPDEEATQQMLIELLSPQVEAEAGDESEAA